MARVSERRAACWRAARLSGVSPSGRDGEGRGRLSSWASSSSTALAAEGETVISDIGHIDRGYASIEGDLRALGADIRRRETDA